LTDTAGSCVPDDGIGTGAGTAAGTSDRPRPAGRTGPTAAGPAPSALRLIFRDIGDLQETGERVGETHRLGEAQALKPVRHQLGRLLGALAVKSDGRLADLLDLAEHRLAVLGADHVSQEASQEADGIAELDRQRLGHATEGKP